MRILIYLFFVWFNSMLLAQNAIQPCYTKLSEVLDCFMREGDKSISYKRSNQKQSNSIQINTYEFASQKWPIEEHADIPSTVWFHKLRIYKPTKVLHKTILLYVGGGYKRDKNGVDQGSQESKEKLDYAEIAEHNDAIVVELQDVPNQFLMMGGEWKREDQILAYTYKKVMEDPLKNAYLAGHLPMAKAIVRAMDVTEKILSDELNLSNLRFIVAGASKRGWAVWLANLVDTRIDAIIPIVIDVLNTQKSMLHICKVYGECPYALRDYKAEKLTESLESKAFEDLMKIEDPFQYLNYGAKYRERMSVPKMIINASGDDFFTPDSSQWYFKDLPGSSNYIRYLPNSMHYFGGNPISDATNSRALLNETVNSYFALMLKQEILAKISWSITEQSIQLESSIRPTKVTLWTAVNSHSPDFRFLNKHTTWHFLKKRFLSLFTKNICDTCYVEREVDLSTCVDGASCTLDVDLTQNSKQGWRASFLEMHYKIAGQPFVVTTEVKVDHKIMRNSEAETTDPLEASLKLTL